MTSAKSAERQQPLITGDELARMPDHDLCELIDGRIVPMSPTNPEHGRLELNVASALREFARTQNLGVVMTGEVGVFTRWNPDRVRAADVVFISHAQYDRRTKTRGFLDVAPELVVEILSPENRHIDVAQKVREYLDVGVRLVLIVDPDDQSITRHHLHKSAMRYAGGEAVPCDEVLPGFQLSVDAVFAA